MSKRMPISDQFHPERAHADAQGAGGFDAMAPETLERAEDHLLFDVRQRFAGQVLNGAACSDVRTESQPGLYCCGANHARIALQYARALDDVLKFANIAGP